MLTRVAVAPQALADFRDSPVLMKSIHQGLLEVLNAHGRIIFRNEKEAKRFIDACRSAPLTPDLIKKWEVVLQNLHKNNRAKVIKPPDEVTSCSLTRLAEIEAAWAGKVRLMILGAADATAAGVPSDEGILDDTKAQIELATLHAATLTKTVRHLRDLASSTVFPSIKRDAFWTDVLGPIADISRSVTLLDKFLFKGLWYRADRPRQFRNADPEHVVWLLRHLDESLAVGSNAHFVGFSTSTDPNIEETAALIRRAWNPSDHGRLSSVLISLARRPTGFPHDRHLRFNTSIGIAISAGFDRLREPNCWDPHGMSWSYIHMPGDIEKLKQRETEALKLNTISLEILRR